ncbi:MAG TPA: SoxR reducing system RseC family protein [Gallionellaceae bacterium]
MLDARAIVIRLEGEEAVVEAIHGGGCGACAGGQGCSSGSMSKMLCVKPRQFRVRNDIGARVGEEVEVSVAEGVLLRSALTLYALPMVLLFAGALLGSGWAGASSHDAGAAVGAVAGLLAGFALARTIIKRQHGRAAASPVITRCVNAEKSAIL